MKKNNIHEKNIYKKPKITRKAINIKTLQENPGPFVDQLEGVFLAAKSFLP